MKRDHDRLELELQSLLGQALVGVQGWSARGPRRPSYGRAPSARGSTTTSRSLRCSSRSARSTRSAASSADEEVAQAFLRQVSTEAPRRRLEVAELLACSLFHQGSFAHALEQAQRGVALFAGEEGHYDTFPATLGDNAGISCHAWSALALWFLGYPGSGPRARPRSRGARRRPAAVVQPRAGAGPARDPPASAASGPDPTAEWAEATIAAAADRGYAYRIAMGRILRGWALAAWPVRRRDARARAGPAGLAGDGRPHGRRLLPRLARRRTPARGPGRGRARYRRGGARDRPPGALLLLRSGARAPPRRAAPCHRRGGGRDRDIQAGARAGPWPERAFARAADRQLPDDPPRRRRGPQPARQGPRGVHRGLRETPDLSRAADLLADAANRAAAAEDVPASSPVLSPGKAPAAGELLERDGALATLAEARDAAARGEGRVVLRHRRAGDRQDLARHPLPARSGRRARGCCSAPATTSRSRARSGPIRDLVGNVSAALEEALSAGAAPHEIQTLLIAELELPPRPTVLVLEDVHWADDATLRLDHRARAADRLAARAARPDLPRAARRRPAIRCTPTVGAIRADDSVVLELAPLSRERGRLARRRRRGRGVRRDRRQPVLRHRAAASRTAAELPPSVANAVLGTRVPARRRRAPPRGARLGRAEPRAHVGAGRGDARTGPRRRRSRSAASCSRSTPTYVRFRHELARNAIRSSVPIAARRRLHAEILAALLAADADPADIVHHAEAAGAEDVVADYALVAARRAAALESNREAYSHYRRAVGLRRPAARTPSRRPCSRSWRRPRTSSAGSTTRSRRSSARSRSTGSSATRRPSAAARGSSRASTGSPATARRAREGASRRSRSSSRSASRSSSPAPTAGSRSSRCSRRTRSRRSPGASARSSSRPGSATSSTRAHALVNIGSARIQLDHRRDRDAARGARRRRRRRRPARGDARARQPRLHAHVLGAAGARRSGTRSRRSPTREEHEVHDLASVRRHRRRLAAAARRRVGRGRAAHAARDRERHHRRRSCSRRRCSTELAVRRGDPDAAERLAELAAQADRAGELQRIAPVLELAAEWALTTRRADADRAVRASSSPRSGRAGASAGCGRDPRRRRGRPSPGSRSSVDEPMSAPHAAMLRRDWRARPTRSARWGGRTTGR